MKAFLLLAVATVVTLGVAPPAEPQDQGSNDPLADRVAKAIAKSAAYLKKVGNERGNWEVLPAGENPDGGGYTALAVLALLNAGVPVNDPAVQAGLKYLRGIERPSTYVRALSNMVFVEAGLNEDLQRIQKNVQHFLEVSALRDKQSKALLGWTYDKHGGIAGRPDNSCTQYALLGIYAAHNLKGIAAPKEFWEEVRAMYARSQTESGAWPYAADGDKGGLNSDVRLTMTTAGLCGLLMAQMEINTAKAQGEKLDPVAGCGVYEENSVLTRGFNWIYTLRSHDRFRFQDAHPFYNIYGIERLGRLSGQRFIGPHDWYREGCRWLLERPQQPDGSWGGGGALTGEHPIVSTSFALLFLSKGRTPILMSKMVHGTVQRLQNDEDWNRRRNDLRHFVDFCQTAVFQKKTPLAWQTFDILGAFTAAESDGVRPAEQDNRVTADLLQSPILYITGHKAPDKRIHGRERDILKKYVENGGFIFATACCGAKEFDQGFQQLCRELWVNNELTTLDVDHPIWNMKFDIKPGSVKLKGIQMGCKTVVVYCPDNLTGYWELNLKDRGEGKTAFELGANIVAYATGLEAPKPRLTDFKLAVPVRPEDATVKRGYFQVGQLISRPGEEADWKPAPEAMAKLMQNLRGRDGLDVVLKTQNVAIDSPNLIDWKFLYMHGRKDFRFTPEQLKHLQFNLKNGGLLLADACCGKEAFDKAFRQFILDLFPAAAFPDEKEGRLVPIPADDVLYSADVNGEQLGTDKIQLRLRRGEAPQPSAPRLEGVKIKGRWVVIYSPYDIGCALENHQAADCIGYTHDSALKLGRAAVLYQLRP